MVKVGVPPFGWVLMASVIDAVRPVTVLPPASWTVTARYRLCANRQFRRPVATQWNMDIPLMPAYARQRPWGRRNGQIVNGVAWAEDAANGVRATGCQLLTSPPGFERLVL